MKTLHPQRYLSLFAFSLLLVAFFSCEKPIGDDEQEKPTTSKTDKDNTSGGNGGWTNDQGSNVEGDDWQDGDTLSVEEFLTCEEGRKVWVSGFIAGSATGAKGYSYNLSSPFLYETAILLADEPQINDVSHAMAIQLKSGSRIRKDLNLVSNPSLYGKSLIVYGVKTSYLRLPGMKDVYKYHCVE